MKHPATSRFVIYACLGFGTILFGGPMLWLFSTALMPREQTMLLPPRWVPLAHYAVIDGRRLEVVPGERISTPGVWVETVAGEKIGRRRFIAATNFRADDASVRVLKRVEPGWQQVTERPGAQASDRPLAADVVPPEAIETRVRPRWENFSQALATMGGGSAEAAASAAAPTPANSETQAGFVRFAANTLIVCVLGVIGTVLSNAIIAYGFARMKWRGRETFFALTLATMMVTFPVLMVPLFGVFKSLGLIGTLAPLWLPAFFGNAFYIFLMRQFFRTIPEELSEAARIDGCSEWAIFWRIILPLCRPVLAVAALFHFLWAWNDFIGPLLFLTRRPTFTLALALQKYQSQHTGTEWQLLMAATVVVVLPLIVLFLFTQKTFVQGVATTGSKG